MTLMFSFNKLCYFPNKKFEKFLFFLCKFDFFAGEIRLIFYIKDPGCECDLNWY
jgi:hypothetical protein